MPARAARRPRLPAEQTRAQILAAAEQRFAARGFSATRLEDVASDVGVRRAALFYYFADKSELYAAVQQEVFGGLLERLRPALGGPGPLARRIEAGIGAWVDYVAERPSAARLILREAADATADEPPEPGIAEGPELLQLFYDLLERGERSGELRPVHSNPFHFMSAIAGSTVFHFAALPVLLPRAGFDPLSPESIAAHKRDVLRIARNLLGVQVRRP